MITRSNKRKSNRKTRKLLELECKKNRSNKFLIGTSGFMISQKKWMDLACLNCIEINGTFYRLPTENTINKWKEFPPHVSIVIKASRYITHMKRLKNVEDAWKLLWNKIQPLGKRLKCILFQLPPSFAYNDVNLQRIIDMHKYVPKDLSIAFEFRNSSWLNEKVYKTFKSLKWCIVSTYIQKNEGTSWMGTMPGGLNIPPKTANFTYLRIHGARGYKGELDNKELKKIRSEITKQKSNKNFVMFNNTFFNSRSNYCIVDNIKIKYAAVCNAVEFSSI